jgi:hypothetical protein
MKNFWKWLLYGLAVFLLAFCIALPLFGGGWGFSGGRMGFAGSGMHGWMMGGWGALGWIGMILRLLLPIAVVGLCIALGVSLYRARQVPPPAPPTPSVACPKCGKAVETAWVACPFCGKKL